MLVPLQIPTLFISNLLVQLFSPATAAQCACDQKPEHGFLKLIGTPSQRQFDLWMEFGEKLEVVEMTLRQNYPTLQFPYEVAMQLYKGGGFFGVIFSILDFRVILKYLRSYSRIYLGLECFGIGLKCLGVKSEYT